MGRIFCSSIDFNPAHAVKLVETSAAFKTSRFDSGALGKSLSPLFDNR